LDGLMTTWYKSGQKREERNYKVGKQDGLWIYYNPDGTERSRNTYKDGEEVHD
jgi:antitoxin component YwqK of YwqJK toxin-antitoxin module